MLRPSLLLFLVATVSAQEMASPVPMPRSHFQGVFLGDADADGATWVRGERFKLGLRAGGATYVPLFGPKAARDFPLHLSLRDARFGATALVLTAGGGWRRDAERFARERGGVRECWLVGREGAQQYFEIDRAAGNGDLVLTIDAATDMAVVDSDDGVRFVAPGLGEVRCSDAVVIDARGRRLEVPVQVVGGALAIVVPAAFQEQASWPLVVDPLLTTWSIDNTVSDIQDARVACEPTSGNWLVVAEEHLSATDVDIVCYRYDTSAPPQLLDTVYAENGTDRANNPAVGFVAQTQQFIVAWHNASAGNFQWRNRSSTSTTMGVTNTTSNGVGSDLENRPAVGSTLTSDRFLLVVFRRVGGASSVTGFLHRDTGANFGNILIGPLLASPQGTMKPGGVSVARDLADKWVVVWRECPATGCSTQLVRMQAIVSNNGFSPLTAEPPQTLETAADLTEPDVAGHGGNLLAVWRAFDATTQNNEVHGVPIAISGGVYAPQGPAQNLSAQEPGVPAARSRIAPSVAYDGCRFVYGYLEDDGTDLHFPKAATVFVNGSNIAWHEGHLALSTVPGLACRTLDIGYGDPDNFGVHWAVFQQDSAAFTGNVHAARIDARRPGITSTVTQTGCGLPAEPGIALTGTPALGRTFSIGVPNPQGFTFILVGTPNFTPLPGCGSCVLGPEQSTMLVFSVPSLSVSVPCEASMLSLRLAFQGLVGLQAGGCPQQVFGLAFALSDTITIQVR